MVILDVAEPVRASKSVIERSALEAASREVSDWEKRTQVRCSPEWTSVEREDCVGCDE